MRLHAARKPSNKSRSAGQTMLEAIVASGIIVSAVGAALTLVQSSISAAKESDNRLVASSLAREGVEVVRMMRDSNWLAGRDFDDGLEGASQDYSAIPVFDAASKSWSMVFAPATLADADTAVYQQTVAGGFETVGLYRQGIPQPNGTRTTLYKRIVHLRALCSDPGSTTPNFIGYDIKEEGESCATEKIGIEVRSEVGWTSLGGTPHTVTAVERIFDWR